MKNQEYISTCRLAYFDPKGKKNLSIERFERRFHRVPVSGVLHDSDDRCCW